MFPFHPTASGSRSPDRLGGSEIVTVSLDLSDPERPKASPAETFVSSRFLLSGPKFSPDGRWIAYVSGETGRPEIYVRPFPGPGGKWQISTGGGAAPVWSRSSPELFYDLSDAHISVARYTAKGESFVSEQPRLWSERWTDLTRHGVDIMPDGKHFVILSASEQPQKEGPQTHATFLFNFLDELPWTVVIIFWLNSEL
jgi:serine/threonine-protein kinase